MAKVVSAAARRSERTVTSDDEPQKHLESWDEFEAQLRRIRKKLRRNSRVEPHLLFRGQENAAWPIETTLERSGHKGMLFSDYYKLIFGLRPEIESLVGGEWERMPDYRAIEESMATPGEFSVDILNVQGFPAYDYMVYLRHHGFPSPLLDWSRSPFVAAYFAFRKPTEAANRVSISVYCEHPTLRKRLPRYEPVILSHGPSIRSHRRHFLQQSEYTSCLTFRSPVRFAPHEDVFGRLKRGQDFLWKFTIPSTERINVLRYLDAHNLNAFSLFGSEESLMETMALRSLGRAAKVR
jgi:hypothetical protein